MNLLEHYIIGIYSTRSIKIPELLSDTYIEVDVEYSCHGYIGRVKRLFTKEEWNMAMEKGYYIA